MNKTATTVYFNLAVRSHPSYNCCYTDLTVGLFS